MTILVPSCYAPRVQIRGKRTVPITHELYRSLSRGSRVARRDVPIQLPHKTVCCQKTSFTVKQNSFQCDSLVLDDKVGTFGTVAISVKQDIFVVLRT